MGVKVRTKHIEGVKYKGLSGVSIQKQRWEDVDISFEPSGHWHKVYDWVTFESWFHPYNGTLPTQTN